MTKGTPLSDAELQTHYDDQIRFIKASSEAFDAGEVREAKRLAIALRILLHDPEPKPNSKQRQQRSLCSLLGKKHDFLDTATPPKPGNLLSHSGLTYMMLDSVNGGYRPRLNDAPTSPKLKPFVEWWSTPVIVDTAGAILTRKGVVMTMADQDGGAHVDSELERKYSNLRAENSMGWIRTTQIGEIVNSGPLLGVEFASVRQIAHEVLSSLGEIPCAWLEARAIAKITGPNDPCPCGGGKKIQEVPWRALKTSYA